MTIITVISQQPLTTEQVNSFRSVPQGIDLATSGDGLSFLSDDGTYRSVVGTASSTNLSVANKTSNTFDVLSSTGTDVTLPPASITEAGLLVASDKVKLNSLGTASYLNVPVSGNAASGEVVKGNDARLSDSRTPLSHIHAIADVTGLQAVLDGKFNNPTGDTTQYLAGDGSLVAFPIAGQAGTLVRQVRNETGSTITKGTVVYISGASGNKALVNKGLATSDATSAQTFGVVQADIPTNNNGYVVVRGDLIGINTSAYLDGTQLYLSGSVAGTFTSTKPVAPIHMVYVGVVTRQHATQGQVEVAIQNGYEMDELHDVLIVSKANKDVIFYDSISGLWKNKQLATSDVVGLDTELSSKQPLTTVLTNTTASFTTTLETKLNGIASGAEVNVNADWDSISGDSQILNKPATFPPSTHTHASTDVTDFNTAVDVRVTAGISGKQDALVSGTTIKTVNGNNLLGSGNIAISGGATNLSLANNTTTTIDILSDTGTDVTLPQATTSLAGLMSSVDKTKLNGVATGATANSSDATLLARANHTGTQLASTISDFNTTADARVVAGITGKENTITAGTTAQYWRGDKSWQTLNSASVGLASVDNTSDATKNAAIATLTNKTISGATNTLSDIAQSSVTGLVTDLSNKQPLDNDLTAIAALAGTTGFLKKTALDTWTLDTSTYYLASNPSGYTTNTGTVTTASVVSANGFAGSVATAGTTPAITLSTTITGIIKGNGTAISAATAGIDYLSPTGSAASLTGFTSGQVTTALGFTPYNATNPSGYTTNTGTVTTTSIVTANGFSGSVATASTTPAITLTLQDATSLQSGQLTPADWNTFNGKQDSDVKLTSISGLSNLSTGLIKLTAGVASFDSSTYLTANQTITVTGDVSGSGTTAVTLNLGNNVVTNAKLAQVATATFKGRITASTGNIEDLTATQATSLLNLATTTLKGLVPATGTPSGKFLKDDLTWGTPAGGGGGLTLTEFEVDFGTKPVRSKKFIITAAGVSGSSKVIVSPSGNVATGRVGDDWEWDAISTSAKAGTGQFVLTCFASGKVAGKRKFYYTYS